MLAKSNSNWVTVVEKWQESKSVYVQTLFCKFECLTSLNTYDLQMKEMFLNFLDCFYCYASFCAVAKVKFDTFSFLGNI